MGAFFLRSFGEPTRGRFLFSLIYQFWIHTDTIRRLPAPLEFILNIPSHHRVHHGIDLAYLDRNHGGVLIIRDRLFGTFTPSNTGRNIAAG